MWVGLYASVEFRGQLRRASSLLPPLHGLWELNSCQAYAPRHLDLSYLADSSVLNI